MNTLEKIVPSLELCKKIPDGEFKDTAMVWMHRPALEGISNEPFMVDYRIKAECLKREMYPAPTLEEILDEMVSFRASFCVHGMAIGNNFYGYPTSAEEALLMWLKLKGIEVEK